MILEGKRCVVTGASSGIGLATAEGLAGLGADVVIVARDAVRGEAALGSVSEAGPGTATLHLADLSVQSEVRRLAAELLDAYPRIDVLVNNAGGLFERRTSTPDGLELTFALNHLAYFLLTELLRERLVASAPARIINVSSMAHRLGKLDWDDLQSERRYRPFFVYANSKLANILFTRELARRLQGTGVTANAMHPGAVASRFGENGGALMRMSYRAGKLFMRTPEHGADTVVWLASAPEIEGVSGSYFDSRKRCSPSRRARDREAAARLWRESERLVAASESAVAASESAES
ncbi:SDR family oxidoreductase [Haliangium ochraceum]|uniref:Short-chain dehydrogenase/reductase SDR n=1 Tax=Haliangium ochraceum (strain DSM 14365 / JCM 11303 / SMP-2) TaxID=502025 RepID=D0LG16_HALO1|nr:SDR family oxidoreductase [Haliangium ochraceum]ACY14618.1 short-chain dehydrogenase/reductase SDR [Haliangium ochraceum DSM 14365]